MAALWKYEEVAAWVTARRTNCGPRWLGCHSQLPGALPTAARAFLQELQQKYHHPSTWASSPLRRVSATPPVTQEGATHLLTFTLAGPSAQVDPQWGRRHA